MIKISNKFLNLFIVQFLGAFNDNLLKNSLVLLITYKSIKLFGLSAQVLVALCAALFILPFFLFSSYAGVLADRYQKIQIAKLVKISEVLIMVLAAIGFYFDWYYLLILALFLMGIHSAFFGPIKYSLIPHYVEEKDLLKANSWVSTGTFVAILLGTILGGVLASLHNVLWLVVALFVTALMGLKFSLDLSPVEVVDRDLPIGEGIWITTKKVLKLTMKEKDIFSFIMGISWFWLLGSAVLTLIPTLAKNIFYSEESVATLFLSIFVIGMGVGPFVLEKFSRSKIHLWLIPVSLLLMSMFIFDLAYLANKLSKIERVGELYSFSTFFESVFSYRVLIDLFFISFFGGVFTVPQFTMIQKIADPRVLSRLIAGNNIFNALFMVTISVVLMLLTALKFPTSFLFGFIGLINIFMSLVLAYVHREEFNKYWRF